MDAVYTVGHSTHTSEAFLALLRQHDISAVCDVRSTPYSRMNPQFNRENLQRTLRAAGIAYVFLGRELGARTDDPSCYLNGKVQYERLAQTTLFREGLARLCEGAKLYRVAAMCAEREPLECHRTLLVSRQLLAAGHPVWHILADGRLESHEDALQRLVALLKLPDRDLFRSAAEIIEDAYRIQGARMAYSLESGDDGHGNTTTT